MTNYIFTKSVFLGLLIVLTGCSKQLGQITTSELERDELASVVTTITIDGNLEGVFDIITTARFWPQWHPATTEVGGVTQRPYQLGDRIHERGRIRNKDYLITWKVTEYIRPTHVVLRSERSAAEITYSFHENVYKTVFERNLEFRMEDLDDLMLTRDQVVGLMKAQSESAVNEVKNSVEKILREESRELR